MDLKIIEDGLRVSAIGLGFVFLVLFILTFSVFFMSRIEELIKNRRAKNLKEDKNNEIKNKKSDFSKEINMAAAVGLALALDERRMKTSNIINSKKIKTSSWSSYGRTRQFFSRMRTKR